MKIFVTPSSDAALANIYDAPYTDRAVKTVSLLASGEEIINGIATVTGLDPQSIKAGYKVNYVTGTQIIEIKITNSDPQNVAAIAQAIPPTIDNLLKTIQQDTDEKNRIKVSIAEQSSRPVQDNTDKIETVGLILILTGALGWGLFYLLGLITKDFEMDQEMETLGVNYLGKFGYINKFEDNLEKILEEDSPVSEALREIRTNIIFDEKNALVRTISATSPSNQEGKTSFIIALGLVLSEAGKRVVMIDANLCSPAMSKMFSTSERYGLSDFFNDTVTIENVIVKTRFNNLWLVPAGSKPKLHPSTVLSQKSLADLKKWFSEVGNVDYILIDSSSINSATDAAVIAKNSDGVIILAEHSKTSKAQLKKTRNALNRINANILGVVTSKIKIG